MSRLFTALFCLLLLAPAAFAQAMPEWIVISGIDWGDGARSRGNMKASGVPASIVSPRDAASGLPTGKRTAAPRDAASGLPTGKRQHKRAAPRDTASGLPTGKRQHRPIVIVKPVDKATPLLMRAHQSGKILPPIVLTGRNSTSAQYLRFQLKQARIVSYSVSGSGVAATEKVTLVYESIQRVGR